MTTITVEAERRWIHDVRNAADWTPWLQEFAAHYHYFSLNQIRCFSNFLRILPVTDAVSLAEVAKVVYEELGEGSGSKVHSVLFRRFAECVGVASDRLPLPRAEVLPGLLRYLDELERVFTSGSVELASAGYLFLEESAVRAYEPLLALFEELRIDDQALEFFRIHTEIEIGHAGVAKALAERYGVSESPKFLEEYRKLEGLWDGLWSELGREKQVAVG